MRTLLLVITLAAVLGSAVGRAEPVPIITCGQTVDGEGALVGDLDCSAFDGDTIRLTRSGTVLLNGFTLTGNSNFGRAAVRCFRRCRVRGPGAITGAYVGVAGTGDPAVGVSIQDVSITGTNVGAAASGAIRASGCAISGNLGGLNAHRSVRVLDSSVTGNDDYGALSQYGRVILIDSTVTGNGGACDFYCADVYCPRRPVVRRSTCDTSSQNPAHDTWGVCTND